jgi:hypothetical protein
MSNGLQTFLTAAFAISSGNWWLLAATVIGKISGDREETRMRRRAAQAHNDAAKDRLEMVDLLPDAPRTLVLGRVRYVEGVRRRWSSGVHEEKLTMIVSFAGHEIDGFEQWYLNDQLVTLDGDGWVNEAPYRRIDNEPAAAASGVLDGSGAATVALAGPPAAGTTPTAVWTVGSGDSQSQGTASVSVSGTTATVTGGQPGAPVTVIYVLAALKRFVRIRPYVGTDAQNVGADLAVEYPGKITSTDRFAGTALAVMDVVFDTDVFPQGRPNLTAVMRGARCLDPRSGATAFTENLALHVYHYARYARGWALASGAVRSSDIAAAADVCDVSTAFTLRKPDDSTETVTLPRYRGGMTIPDDADHGEAMDALLQGMNGRAGWTGAGWRVRAGALATPVATITRSWLVQDLSGGRPGDDPVISAVQTTPRAQRFNRVTGKCIDPSQRYQLLPFPAVQDSVLVAAKGVRQMQVELPAVSHIAHAQHLASMAIRQAQAGLQLELVCGEQAADLELLDVVALDLPEYGYESKTFEVVGCTGNQVGAFKVALAEISAGMFTPDAELAGRDPAPDSTLRPPWDVEDLSGLAVSSGTAPTLDGSVTTRSTVTWTAAVGENIRQGGRVEVQYTLATGVLPAGDWPNWPEAGAAAATVIPGLLGGRFYLFRARFVQQQPLVHGRWCNPVLHAVAVRRAPTIYRQASAPTTGVQDGDEWIDSDDGNKRYVREAGAWVAVAVGTGGIAPGAVAEVLAELVSSKTYPKSGAYGPVLVDGTTFTPLVDSIAEVTVKMDAAASGSSGTEWGGSFVGVTCQLQSDLTVNGLDTETWTFPSADVANPNKVQGNSGMSGARAAYTLSGRFPVVAGQSYRTGPFFKGATPDFGINFVATIYGSPRVQVTLIKR